MMLCIWVSVLAGFYVLGRIIRHAFVWITRQRA